MGRAPCRESEGNGYVAADNGHVDVTLTGSHGITAADIQVDTNASSCDSTDAGDNLSAAGTCTIVFTSQKAGQVTGDAKVTSPKTVFGTPDHDLVRDTDPATVTIPHGTGGSDTDAVKTFVDANVAITGTATNEVGVKQEVRVAGQKNTGDGSGYVAADNGHVDVTLTGSNGITAADIQVDTNASSCDSTEAGDNLSAAGTCTIVFTSQKAGQVTGDAGVTIPKTGVGTLDHDLVRDTDPATVTIPHGTGGSDTDAVKTFVDANVAITGTATNEVGVQHRFTVTVQKNTGDGNGYVAADNGHVDVTLTGSHGITAADIQVDTNASSCDSTDAGDNLSAAGTCTIVFTSQKAGQVTGDAKVTSPKTVFGTPDHDLVRDTDPATVTIPHGTGGSDTDAVKTFVDANVAITGTATNEVGVQHTFTVTVQKNTGDGNGYVAADNGHVDVTLTGSNGITAADIQVDTNASSCDSTDAGDNLSAAGTCTIVFTSQKAGQVTGDAKVTIPKTVFGTLDHDLVRDTDPATVTIPHGTGGSDTDAVKTFVDANVAITGTATNEVGVQHRFTVTVQKNTGDGNGYVAADNGHVDVTLTGSNGITAADIQVDTNASSCDSTDAGDNLSAAGTCTIVFTSQKAGQVTG